MKALVAALNRIASALEQLVPALQQATREQRYEYHGTIRNSPCPACGNKTSEPRCDWCAGQRSDSWKVSS